MSRKTHSGLKESNMDSETSDSLLSRLIAIQYLIMINHPIREIVFCPVSIKKEDVEIHLGHAKIYLRKFFSPPWYVVMCPGYQWALESLTKTVRLFLPKMLLKLGQIEHLWWEGKVLKFCLKKSPWKWMLKCNSQVFIKLDFFHNATWYMPA